MKLKKLLRVIPVVSTTRVIRVSMGLYGQTYRVMFEGQCEKIPYWLVDFEVMAVTSGDGKLIIEVCDE